MFPSGMQQRILGHYDVCGPAAFRMIEGNKDNTGEWRKTKSDLLEVTL